MTLSEALTFSKYSCFNKSLHTRPVTGKSLHPPPLSIQVLHIRFRLKWKTVWWRCLLHRWTRAHPVERDGENRREKALTHCSSKGTVKVLCSYFSVLQFKFYGEIYWKNIEHFALLLFLQLPPPFSPAQSATAYHAALAQVQRMFLRRCV